MIVRFWVWLAMNPVINAVASVVLGLLSGGLLAQSPFSIQVIILIGIPAFLALINFRIPKYLYSTGQDDGFALLGAFSVVLFGILPFVLSAWLIIWGLKN